MRERTTWQNKPSETPRQAATQRQADIYTMNQEHPQPTPVDYENGNPDTWAETPVPGEKMTVNDEYEGGHVKRNELNFGEFRDDTWKHKDSDHWHGKGKYDNAKVSAERKAQAAERVARVLLRTSNDQRIEAAALELMALPDKNLVATLKHIDSVSPDALSPDAKRKRAFACTKLAARLLGEEAKEEHVEHLATAFMSIDDPTLKTILKIVATSHVAQEQEEQEEEQEGSKTSQQQEEEQQQQQQGQQQQQQGQEQQQAQQQQGQQEEITSQQQQQGQQQEEQEEEITSQQEAYGHGLSPEEHALLDSMLKEECGPGDELTAIFEAPAQPAPAMPAMAAGPDVSFDDDDDDAGTTTTAASGDELGDLFGDDPEVQAQRQIKAAEQEQVAREGGFAVGRTASAKGAKKIGQVQRGKAPTADQALEALWDRP